MSDPVVRFPYVLPRTAFSPRDAARAGDVWRAFQDVAVEGATQRGWSPIRMREVGSYWVVRAMTVVHDRETQFGEAIEGVSWVRRMRRGTLSTREVRLRNGGVDIARGSQEWAHLGAEGLTRMPPEMASDLGIHEEGGVELPDVVEAREGATFELGFEVWETWMDPLGHVNHPHYVDFCDESVSRFMRAKGLDPLSLVPVAESLTFRSQVVARERATVRSKVVGTTAEGDIVIDHLVSTDTTERATDARTIRRVLGGARELARFARAMGLGPDR